MVHNMELRRLLDEVAAGEVAPEDAAARLRALRGQPRTAQEVDRSSAITRLRVRSSLAEGRIIGDPAVAGAVADGPHEARTDGSTITIDDRIEGRGFTFGAGRGLLGLGRRAGRLEIRANPDLELDLELKAGDMTVTGMQGPVTATVTASSLRLDGFRGPIDLQVRAGDVEGQGRLTDGRSVVGCRLGEVRLDLHPDSDVTVTARARLGEVRLPDGRVHGGVDIGDHRYVFGEGTATLDVDAAAGAVDIRSRP